MTKRRTFSLVALIAMMLFATPVSAQMSDEAVIRYVKSGLSNGKSQDQLTKELALKGVSKEQALRIKARMEADNEIPYKADKNPTNTRARNSQQKTTKVTIKETVKQPETNEMSVFGREVFSIDSLSFAPTTNIATPVDYKLGPGDEVIIDIWGTNQATICQTISPDGFINVEGIGIIYLGGMTIEEADNYMRRKLSQIYSVGSEDAQSEIKLTLGAIRTITINIMGEVVAPGTYSLSSLSTIYHALYIAGGFNKLGSVRNVSLVRNGKKIKSVDVYDFIINGKTEDDVTLQDGDIILVPTYEAIASISGNVKRPMKYEMKEGESFADLLTYAGGFKGDAYTTNVMVERRNGRELQVYTVENSDFSSFNILDGDSVNIGTIINRYENRIEIRGAVYRPGFYQLGDKVNTVSELIAIADGLCGDAFTNRALLHRERKDYTLELIPIDVRGIIDGTAEDVKLQKNDILTIPSVNDIRDIGYITIMGEVAFPGEYRYAENATIEDAILQAGGLLESASTAKVDVSRRIKDPKRTIEIDTTAQVFTFSIDNEYKIHCDEPFKLEPYDYIYVRRSPSYNPQIHVSVKGEVLFPGNYALTNKSMRLSDIINQAGGVSSLAYVKGAKLERKMNEDEIKRVKAAMGVLEQAEDPDNTTELDIPTKYAVGINLEEALANPGSDVDLVLREGDIIIVPEYTNTVKISGCVLHPNTVTYDSKMTVSDYITQAGGYGFRARKKQAYIVYMNGTASKARRTAREVVEPGCEIIVPDKPIHEDALKNALSIATTSASVATMLGTVYNIIK